MPELRCENKLFGSVEVGATGIFESICQSRFCRVNPDEVVTHRWDLEKVNEDNSITPIQTFRSKRPVVKGIRK